MDKSSRVEVRLVTALFVCMFGSSSFGFDDGDFQFWSTASASFKVTDNWGGKFEEEFRFGDDASQLYYQHSDLGFVYRGLADWLDVGLNFRLVFEKNSAGQWKQENRPHLNATFKGKLNGVSVSNRSRFEYRDREDKKDVWRYRNKLTVKLPIELTELKLKPYIADEIFVDFEGAGVNRNRFYAGLSAPISKRLDGGLYYLWQSSKSAGTWKDINVLGIQLKIHF